MSIFGYCFFATLFESDRIKSIPFSFKTALLLLFKTILILSSLLFIKVELSLITPVAIKLSTFFPSFLKGKSNSCAFTLKSILFSL